MRCLTLEDQIKEYVTKFKVVDEKSLRRFFSCWPGSDVDYVLEGLKSTKGFIHEHPEGRLSRARNLHAPMHRYDDCIDALRVMEDSGSDYVDWFMPLDYPLDLIYGTINDEVYCVSTFTSDSWSVKAGLTEMARNSIRVDGLPDLIMYVAVIRDLSLMDKLEPLGFTYFAHILPNGTVEIWDGK